MRKIFDGIPVSGSHKTPPMVLIREMVEGRPITSRRRTGRALLVDDFEGYTALITEKWSDAQGTVTLDTAFPKQEKSAMKMVTGDADNALGEATLWLGTYPRSRFGIELEFNVMDLIANVFHIFVQYTRCLLYTSPSPRD